MASFADKYGGYCTCTRDKCSDDCSTYRRFKPKPTTNYDRIISKTPEELALWLSDIAEWLPHYAGKAHAILKWLEQEATE